MFYNILALKDAKKAEICNYMATNPAQEFGPLFQSDVSSCRRKLRMQNNIRALEPVFL